MTQPHRYFKVAVSAMFLVAAVTLLVSSSDRQGMTMDIQEDLWNPATYFNVFRDTKSTETADWSSGLYIREQLYKAIQAIEDMQKVRDGNWESINKAIDDFQAQQGIDSNGAPLPDLNVTLAQWEKADDEVRANLEVVKQQENSDIQSLRSQLASSIQTLSATANSTLSDRTQAIQNAKNDLEQTKTLIAKMTQTQKDLSDLLVATKAKTAEYLKTFGTIKAARDQSQSLINTAKAALDAATNKASSAIDAASKAVDAKSSAQNDQKASIGKRLDDVNSALQALSAAQTKLINDVVDKNTQNGKDMANALSDISSSALANVDGIKSKSQQSIDTVSADLSALQSAIQNNKIQDNANVAIGKLNDLLTGQQSNAQMSTVALTFRLTEVETHLQQAATANAATAAQIGSLSSLVASLKANSTADRDALIAQAKAAFQSSVGVFTSQSNADVVAVKKDLDALSASETSQISAIKDLVTRAGKSATDNLAQQGKDLVTIQSAISAAQEAVGKSSGEVGLKLAKLQTQIALDKTQQGKALDDMQARINALTFAIGNITRPAGPQGPPGPAGIDGPVGSDGPAGASGPNGKPGAVGPAGIGGVAGADGALGAQGPAGPAGLPGSTGPAGGSGSDGAVGAAGLSGIKGPKGLDGAQGEQGAVGAQGPPGERGPAGPVGPPSGN